MRILIFILSIYIANKTFSYGLFEWKKQQNKIAGIVIFGFATISLIVPIIMINIRV